jgi:hypothetical protein
MSSSGTTPVKGWHRGAASSRVPPRTDAGGWCRKQDLNLHPV